MEWPLRSWTEKIGTAVKKPFQGVVITALHFHNEIVLRCNEDTCDVYGTVGP